MIKPLFINTGSQDYSMHFHKALQDLGADCIHYPLIHIQATTLTTATIETLQQLSQDHCVVFTSKNGVCHFVQHYQSITGKLPMCRYFCLGAKTAVCLESYGLRAEFIGEGVGASQFLHELNELNLAKEQVILALGNLAPQTLQDNLIAAKVERINVYQTVGRQDFSDKICSLIKDHQLKAVIFNSPSAVRVFQEKIAPVKQHTCISIGTRTGSELEKYGQKHYKLSKSASEEGILSCIKENV